ncbi:TIGR02147 family protein [Fibrobacter succinogenes]|uniref:TIGR02147 family protein n=1 Tax=Fibrobacter succinogenes TaxID=833 RepID=UPI001565AC0A|nr:TIGR02147 family protein [Fibrobacter succinogenes]
MKPVMEYQNFRLYVRDFYTERKIRSGFTWRDFAKAAGYSSPVFLKLVCDGKANLSDVGIERVANAMGLVGTDLQYFRALVNFNQEKDSSKKKEVFKELRAIAKENEMTLVGEDQYDYYESWINPVLRELVPQVPEATPAQVADMLAFDTQAAEVKKALKLLEKVGLLNKNADGSFEQSSKAITTGNIEVTSLSVREMHRQMGELAVRSLDEVPVNERDISGLTLGISESAYSRITKEIEDFRRRVASIVLQETEEDRVYRLNVQLFPLTKKFKGGVKNA